MQLRDSQKAIGIDGDHITYVCDLNDAPVEAETITLADTVLLPGFVNAHCHLDLSHMKDQFSYNGSFSGWIQEVMAQRLTPDADAMRSAAQALIQSGVTSVNDHVGAWSDLSSITDLPLRYRFFVEVSGVTPETAATRLQMAQDLAIQLQREGKMATATPHSSYSLHAATRDSMIGNATTTLSIHYAESAEEKDYFVTGAGKMADFLHDLGAPQGKPTAMPFPKSFLAVHCNTVTDDDIQRLKTSGATVVHCPRSHRYFNHPPFPLQKLRDAGIPIQIGTDSLASCPNMDFLEELRAMREEFPFLTATEILKMASGNCQAGGAAFAPGQFADIVGLPMQDDILQGPVTFSMIGGKRVI